MIILVKIILALGISALVLFGYVNEHEKAHKQIYLYSGCNIVSIHWTWTHGASTLCHEKGYRESEQTIFLHSLNEIVGYNVQALIMVIMIFILFWIIKM